MYLELSTIEYGIYSLIDRFNELTLNAFIQLQIELSARQSFDTLGKSTYRENILYTFIWLDGKIVG